MAIRKDQIGEVLSVVLRYVPDYEFKKLVVDLKQTAAYKGNESFRVTVQRLEEASK